MSVCVRKCFFFVWTSFIDMKGKSLSTHFWIDYDIIKMLLNFLYKGILWILMKWNSQYNFSTSTRTNAWTPRFWIVRHSIVSYKWLYVHVQLLVYYYFGRLLSFLTLKFVCKFLVFCINLGASTVLLSLVEIDSNRVIVMSVIII